MSMYCGKMADLTEMPLGVMGQKGLRNSKLEDPILMVRGKFLGKWVAHG